MNIPAEFKDYLTSPEYLSPVEQEERLQGMLVDEILSRAKLMHGLNMDKDTVVTRLKRNMQWAFELGTLPTCYQRIESLVEDVYRKPA